MTPSNLETTNSPSPNGQDSSWRRLLSALWHWISSYRGLSELRSNNEDLRNNNKELRKETELLRKETEALKQQNARLAELESKLDIVLQSSDSSLNPTISTDNNSPYPLNTSG